ncbi:MAG: hypothetical protein R8L07_19835 [Alphaproteobacteria bacterium]|nr:hypothetical protein [Alphaproteobacteria bacterium]
MLRETVSTILFLLIAILTVATSLLSLSWLGAIAAGLVVLFLLLEFSRIPGLQRGVGTALLCGGIGAAALTPDPIATLRLGLEKTLPFLLLFASVAWLQVPSGQSPSLLAVRETVLRQPPGRRFAWVAAVGHFLGVAFNLAGLSLLTPMVESGKEERLQKRLGRAMIQGFGAGTCWSPLYVGTAVIIASVPGVSWVDVGPIGFLIALLLLAWSWSFDRLFARRATPSVANPPGGAGQKVTGMPAVVWGRLFLILCSLFGCIIGFVEGLGWSIPVALAVTAPVYALIWSQQIHRAGAGPGPSAVVRRVVSGLPGLRGEALLFTGANVLGVGVAALIPDADAAGTTLPIAPTMMLVMIMIGYAVLSAAGLHPVVTVVLVTSILTPDVIGVSPAILALALMVMWGQGTNVSPFSATVLYMARVTGRSGWTVAWRWNGPFGITATALLAVIIAGLNLYGFG